MKREMKEVWTTLASMLGVIAFMQSVLHAVIPPELRYTASRLYGRILSFFSPFCYFDVTEIDGVNTNELYNAVQLYLSRSASVDGTRLSLIRAPNASTFTFSLTTGHHLLDYFAGAAATWEHVVTQRQSPTFSWRPVPDEKRTFTLRIAKKDKPRVLPFYLDHIMDTAVELRRRNQDRLLYTNSRGGSGGMESRGNPWDSVPFKHPSTFATLAMDPTRKEEIMADLTDFAGGKSFYEKTGRAWKRGYLLYGPPGTGKSSMIAAMANFLRYDIYDLELTEVNNNSELRKLLMKTTSKSIIVIEDIDCSINLTNQRNSKPTTPTVSGEPDTRVGEQGVKSVTLSGLLNFTDGLWSCCGSEKIFVFTTNHVDKLDPALLRSGRMDMHIFMGFCSFPAVKILLKNYLGIEEGDNEPVSHEVVGLMSELEEAIRAVEITPADVSEILIKNRRRESAAAIRELIQALKSRRQDARKIKGGSLPLLKKKKEGSEAGEEEQEEQEKRALESPKDGVEAMLVMSEGKDETADG